MRLITTTKKPLDDTPMSQEEYAASIGTTYGTVRNKLTRTRHKLKALMD